jgi:signal transduction histidine kinase
VPLDQAVAPLLIRVIEAQGADLQRYVTLRVTPPDLHFGLDAKLIDIAVNNLLGNALRYTDPSSMNAGVTLYARLSRGGLRISVTDQGPGLTDAELARLGQPYYRASTALAKQGTGLGYYFSQLIVQAHSGTISAVNRVGGGLVVTLWLPRAK